MADQVSFSGGEKLNAVLRDLADRLGKPATLRVGFLEGSTDSQGVSNPLKAAILNYGAPGRNIPPRPFFSGMVATASPKWGDELGRIVVAADYEPLVALGRMGLRIAGQLQKSILDTNDPPLAAATVAAKGFAKPLIDTADMINSVAFDVNGEKGDAIPAVSSGRLKSAGGKR